MPHTRRFFDVLCLLLLGYACDGKPVAYLGVSPLYVGELTMAYGVFALASSPNATRVLRSGWLIPLLMLMAWCAVRTIPFLKSYGVDALHDGGFWMWGTYAIVIASLMGAEPHLIRYIERKCRLFFKITIIWAPFAYITLFMNPSLPNAPWCNVPLILVKGGDLVVHLMGGFAFAVLLGGLPSQLVIPFTIINLIFYFTGRASMVVFAMGVSIILLLKPRAFQLWGVLAALVIGVLLMWVLDVNIGTDTAETGRRISASQIVQNIYSIFGDSDNQNLRGSKEWRLKWWDKIFDYTLHGQYFWTGKGFGVNLADDDGFQVEEDHSLRNPHNGHLTMLARAGVPGFALWILCQVTLLVGLVSGIYSAYRRQDGHWFSFMAFLLIYWLSYLVNASFDVFLEGPVGGIWFWCVYGLGIGSVWLYHNVPDSIDLKDESELSAEAVADSTPGRRVRKRKFQLSCAS